MPGKSAKGLTPIKSGLTSQEARKKLTAYGPNTLPQKGRRSWFSILLSQFANPLILILLAASTVTIVLGEVIDTWVILIAVGINTVLGFFQEYKAENAIHALKKLLTPQARVMRDGSIVQLSVRDLVPGDIVLLSPGDRVPADGVLVEAVNLSVNEAVLTGESMPVAKRTDGETDEYSKLYMGTVISSGRATMAVVETGTRTKIGQLAVSLEDSREGQTPLQVQLGRLARILALLVVGLCTGVFVLGLLAGRDIFTMGTTAVAIAVSAVPEGMVVSLTAILALGMSRIAKRKAIVRTLVASETLGSVTTICVDKTGTITQGVMKVVKTDLVDTDRARLAAKIANNLSDPLEIALLEWAGGEQEHQRLAELPFDETRKYMSVTTNDGVWIKGAPEVVLEKCKLTQKEKNHWEKNVTEYGKEGLRVLALAHNTNFLGIIGIADPVREGVPEAIRELTNAGIKVIIVTGDYRGTAEAVMREIGMHVSPENLFYRVTPADKLKIVTALQARGEVVAMTGDGVNDAAAIKKADIGIVVADASDVAKETADMVLVDSNIRTIAEAVEEGRAMFENIRKVVLYLISDSFVEISIISVSIVLGLPLPLTALQILWINLVDDGLPSLALTLDPTRHGLMRERPRATSTPIVDSRIATLVVLISISTTILVTTAFVWAIASGHDLIYAQTLVFTMVALDSLLYVFASRRMHARLTIRSFFHNWWLVAAVSAGLVLQLFAVYHPWGERAFGTVPLGAFEWLIVTTSSVVLLAMIEGTKVLFLRAHPRGVPQAQHHPGGVRR